MQAVRKLHGHLKAVKEAAVERKLPQVKPITLTPQEQSLDEDLNEAAQVSLPHPCCMLSTISVSRRHSRTTAVQPVLHACDSARVRREFCPTDRIPSWLGRTSRTMEGYDNSAGQFRCLACLLSVAHSLGTSLLSVAHSLGLVTAAVWHCLVWL